MLKGIAGRDRDPVAGLEELMGEGAADLAAARSTGLVAPASGVPV